MEKLKSIWNVFALFAPFWPIIVIPILLGFIRITITDGLKYAFHILCRLLIALVVLAIILTAIILFT